MINLKPIFFIFILISSLNIFSQDSIILNYEDVSTILLLNNLPEMADSRVFFEFSTSEQNKKLQQDIKKFGKESLSIIEKKYNPNIIYKKFIKNISNA